MPLARAGRFPLQAEQAKPKPVPHFGERFCKNLQVGQSPAASPKEQRTSLPPDTIVVAPPLVTRALDSWMTLSTSALMSQTPVASFLSCFSLKDSGNC